MSFGEKWRDFKARSVHRIGCFMYGRNGADTLYWTSIWCSFGFAIADTLFHKWVLTLLYTVCFGYALFRFFSKNKTKRRKENAAFTLFFRKLFDRKHIYVRCPSCNSTLRLPRVKGSHSAGCPRCGKNFGLKI